MLKKEALGDGRMLVTFQVSKHLWADRVALVGEFNNWDPRSHFLRQTHGDADWHVTLELEAGRSFRFRYLVDGERWIDDDRADGCAPDPRGGFDSVVRT
jgi:1,4-alpha-glucan branching enzyme